MRGARAQRKEVAATLTQLRAVPGPSTHDQHSPQDLLTRTIDLADEDPRAGATRPSPVARDPDCADAAGVLFSLMGA